MCLLAMMAGGMSAKAQEITITLVPGWNWISYTNAEVMSIEEALVDFTPVQGDIVKSQYSSSRYINGRWIGGTTNFMPGWGYMYYSARAEIVELVFAHSSSVSTVATSSPTDITTMGAVVGGMVMLPEGSHVFLRGVCWGTEPNPDIDGDHTSEDTGIGSFSSTLEGLTPNTVYYVRAYAVSDDGLVYGNEVSFTTKYGGGEDHDYVDLGLPSGTLWATCNIGADSPEDYGDYFSWGETQSKSTYNWSAYQYCNGSYNTLTKYCNDSNYGYNGFTDDQTTLLPEDDAATANWGFDWRMPTREEFGELYNNTTKTWTTQNGVNGWLFTASNGNSLFLPAAGYRYGSSLGDAGGNGYYWSSWLNTAASYTAWELGFYSVDYGMYTSTRYYGYSVRAVRSSPTGAINGKFSINANGDQVYFSQGNLQYIGSAATPYWKFADSQWDYLGETTGQNSDDENVDRDLFGWGTSGYNHGAVCYQPWSTSTANSDYYAYGNYQYNLNSQTGQADWGYNPISNGGNQPNQWRTLTNAEWGYVFNTRETTSGIRYAKAIVNNISGVILLPDDWSTGYYSLSNTNSSGASFSSNTITASQWNGLEQLGAVFLPATGHRIGTSVNSVGSYGYYWSSSGNYSNAYFVNFYDSGLYTNVYSRCYGHPVRLVRVAQ